MEFVCSEPKISYNWIKGLKILGFLVASLLVLLVVVAVSTWLTSYPSTERIRDSTSPDIVPENSYSVVIDAGSSGSRVMLYTWSKTRAGLPRITKAGDSDHDWQLKKEPGLSTLSDKLQDVAPYLQTLLDFAMERIPQNQHSKASLHLFATAGLRLLPLETQTKLLQEACNFAKQKYPFKIAACSEHFQVITGEWEGIYGWLTVNYLKNGLGSISKGGQKKFSVNHVNSFGFLDMVCDQ
jgi:Golgi nucleoside diphosphatase